MLVTRTGLSPVMVGRVRELARLERLMTPGGEPRVALIRGEAGVGKTRLIEELVCRLDRKVVVLAAQAEQGAMGRPYELLLHAVGPSVASWSRVPPGLRPTEDALGVLLSPVAPYLQAAERGYAADELARAAIELIRHLIGPGAGVVIFEDLHWADAESLGLFQRLAVAPELRALLVGSYRPEDLDRGHVTDLVAAVERQRQVDHIALDRLSVGEVATMVGAVRDVAVPYAIAAALHRRTGGNPFFLEELIVAAGDAPVDRLADLPLPVNLTEAVLRHLDELDAEQRRVVDAAAILGQRIPFDLLASVTGVGEEGLIDILRELVGKGLIVEDDADVFSFRHALTREAIAGRLLARERRRLHEKSLTALQESGSDDWAALAHHAGGADRWAEMIAAARRGAALYMRTGATYQALRLVELALEEADADVELLELATRAAWSVGLPSTALERAEQWRRLAEESDDLAAVSRALRVLARLRWETDDREGHQAAVEAARAVADTMPGCEERAWVANLLAESAMLTGRNTDAVRWADEALATAGTDCSPELRAAVLVNKGSALEMLPGREEEGEALLIEGLAAAEAVQDHLSALRAINNLSHGVFPLWEPERSAALLARTGDLIERSGRQDWAPRWGLLKATYQAHVLGDLEAARREMTATGLSTGRPWTVLTAAELATEAGELDLATSLLDEIDRGTPSDPFVRGMILGHRVRIAAASRNARRIDGLLDQLAAEVNTTVAGTDDRESDESPSDGWHHALVLALHAGVPAARVRAVLAAVGPLPQAPSRATDPGWPPHLDAALAEAEGRFDDALSGYTQAADPPGWRRSPPAAADADMGAARSLDALGRSDEARVFAAAALSRLQRWPGWRRDEAEGLTRRPAPQSELTNREFEVASLVAEGLTNGEIAARLYISTKTASVHVSNILRKLDMTSRAEVAAWVVRQREPTRD